MKKLLSIVSMLVFVAGFTFAQNPSAKKTTVQTQNKEVKADSTKKVHHAKNAEMKKTNTESGTSTKKSGSK